MGTSIEQIKRVQIIDDDPHVRLVHGYAVEELSLEPVPVENPPADISLLISQMKVQGDAVICDHQLNKRQYAPYNGAEAVAHLYLEHFPALLCTRYEPHIDEIRAYRANIPVVLPPDELNPDSLLHSFKQCINEFSGEYTPSRKAWRALIRVDNQDDKFVYLVVPSWDPHSVIRLLKKEPTIPNNVIRLIEQERERLHAWVNIGAEKGEDLYFKDWEVD